MATTIDREIDEITARLQQIGNVSSVSADKLKAINQALRLDPSNVELTNQKLEVYQERLGVSQQRQQALTDAISLYNQEQQAGNELTPAQTARLQELEKQLELTKIQSEGLSGAIQNQSQAQAQATLTSDTFKKSLTEFNSALSLVSQTSHGINSLYTLMGGSGDSTFGKLLKILPQITMAVKGVAAMMKLAAIATGSWKSALTLGVGAAAIVAGIVAIEAATNKATKGIESANVSSGISGAISAPSTPSVPSYSSSSGGGASNVTVQTLSQRQIEDAIYSAVTRTVLEQGLSDPKIFEKTSVTKREALRWIFSGILNQDGTINAREVL